MKKVGILGYGEIGSSLEKCYLGKEFDLSGTSTYFHANVVTSPDSPDVDVEDGVEITSGKYEGQPIKNAERVVFTPLGDVFAFDSIQTSH